ncbi:MAG TPA: DUF3054 domain-containing protein [Herpetosiphonaceae bacterium]
MSAPTIAAGDSLGAAPSRRRQAALALGDCAVFGLFALIGRRSHGDAAPIVDIARIAAPFAIAWLATAPWAGLYREPLIREPRRAAGRAALAWLAAGPIGLALRSLVFGSEFKPTFAITTMLFNLLLLLGWRAGAAALLRRRAD